MGFCVSSEERKDSPQELDIFNQYQGIKQISQTPLSETKLVADRQTRQLYFLHNVYSESSRHPNALKKEELIKLYETLRKGKHLNMSTVWQVGNSKLDLVYVVQESLAQWTSLKHQLMRHS